MGGVGAAFAAWAAGAAVVTQDAGALCTGQRVWGAHRIGGRCGLAEFVKVNEASVSLGG
ncbi:hypothetical protein RCH12_002792 [Cryobacterium sp. MP_3.1]|nr:hypothetical protein [Cryobacterium sp. MP_3.1]